MVKNYDCEVVYQLGKANVVDDALSYKAFAAPIRDIFVRMKIVTPLLEQIREAQQEAMKEEHWKSERIVG